VSVANNDQQLLMMHARRPGKSVLLSVGWQRVYRMFAAAHRLADRGLMVTSRKVVRRDA